MILSLNEIQDRALKFSNEWADACNEDAEAKPFLQDFLRVFGIEKRGICYYEVPVKRLDGSTGYIDLLWKGKLLVEMKSRGKDLKKAFDQAREYLDGLAQHEFPRFVLICDFNLFRLYDLEEDVVREFLLPDLVKNIHLFGFITGYKKHVYKEQDPVNIKAAELMGRLHDKLKEIGYEGHPLEVYLVRLLFCLFADDTNIFENELFYEFIEERTSPDGSDLAARLNELFYTLNTPREKRLKNIDEQLNKFPYINGNLFEEMLPPASFDKSMRESLLNCCALDWSKISPAIFGAMFQSVMNQKARRNLGAHYTSEKNILKLIKPLFLDELREEFEKIKHNKKRLSEFHDNLSSLRFLDPACGCGNFLVISYRELRLLEIDVLQALLDSEKRFLDVSTVIKLNVDMMAGIEIEEFPARIAEVAMWLIDHQMNMVVSQKFGQYFVRLPLRSAAKIVNGNALQIDWETMVPKEKLSYIIGNPPFIGKKEQNPEQKADMGRIFLGAKGAGVLDYVTAWYIKSAQYIQNTRIKVAFVSTNSISQGEQVGLLWTILFRQYKINIHFAHRTFSWLNEAKGNAAVHCIIVAFANYDTNDKKIFEYKDIKGEPHEIKVKNINPYLVEGRNITLEKRESPISNVPGIIYGSFALDDGNYTLSEEERSQIISENSNSEKLIRPFIGGRELLHSEKRYCLWLEDAEPSEIKGNSKIKERVEAVKKWRSNSNRENTKKLAETPALFAEIRQPKTKYLAFPTLSSENRKYIPITFLEPSVIASNQIYVLPNSSLFHFGVLTSEMHMTWIKSVCGRLESRYRYSAGIVYNNYPWPENPTEKQKVSIEEAAAKVLNVRNNYPNRSLSDLYDPLAIKLDLLKAHQALDRVVDLAYRPQPFPNESKRMEFLFDLYEKYDGNLFANKKFKKKVKNVGNDSP